jgi:predicted nucleic acid-binding protein
MERHTVYIETSIVSYLASRPSADMLTAACQHVTREWWEKRRNRYDSYTSALVIVESASGDPAAVERRKALLLGLRELAITPRVRLLGLALIAAGALPKKAEVDALHIAVAAVHEIDYLLTWNCRHIDNPVTRPLVRTVCAQEGFVCPEICSPLELMESHGHA